MGLRIYMDGSSQLHAYKYYVFLKALLMLPPRSFTSILPLPRAELTSPFPSEVLEFHNFAVLYIYCF